MLRKTVVSRKLDAPILLTKDNFFIKHFSHKKMFILATSTCFMRRQSLITLFATSFIVVFFVRCTRLEEEQPQIPAEFPILQSITYTLDTGTHIGLSTFSYNPDNTLAKITDQSWEVATPNDKKVNGIIQATKQPNGLPYNTYAEGDNPVYNYRMEYLQLPGHQLVERKTYLKWPAPNEEERWFGLDSKNRIVADTSVNIYNQIVYYTVNTYDANDNLVKFEGYSADSSGKFVHAYTTVYTYDQHTNPFYNLKYVVFGGTGFYTFFGKNNMLTHVVTHHLDGYTYDVFNYTYEYDSLGRPTKRYERELGSTLTFEYKR
jgi:hypothetical protein